MRSRPYTPPPPLPPILSELSTYLPNRRDPKDSLLRRRSDDAPLSELHPDTSRLLPQRKRGKRHVRIQGKLAPVRSVSVVNLRSKSSDRRASSPSRADDARFDTAVGGVAPGRRRRRRRSEDDTASETDAEVRERDTQLRGYGIGGAGNIPKHRPSCVRHETDSFARPGHRRHRHLVEDVVAFPVVPLFELRLDDALKPGSG
ncbi:hypothetical protein F4818DRAFT_443101 [Hypoxylon cercidicola]|nr:hypothetical protein F4818DRAFT_443101 [Hypoxylon cercidicola]